MRCTGLLLVSRNRTFLTVLGQCLLGHQSLIPVENCDLNRLEGITCVSSSSVPTLNQVPPEGTQPFIEAHLGPLSVGPPADSELSRIMGGGDGE